MHCPDCGKETEEKDTQPTVGGSRTFFFCSDCEKTWAKEWNDFDQDFSIYLTEPNITLQTQRKENKR